MNWLVHVLLSYSTTSAPTPKHALAKWPDTKGVPGASAGLEAWAAGDQTTFIDAVERTERAADVERLKMLVADESQHVGASPAPLSKVLPDREDGGSSVLLDPEDLEEAEEDAGDGRRSKRVPPGADTPMASHLLASPSPVPKGTGALAPLGVEPEEPMAGHGGEVLLSIPLSEAEKAKAISEAVSMICDNTCAFSHDGVCQDGAVSTSSCSNAPAFTALGRGSCAAAASSECDLGTDCAPQPSPLHSATRPAFVAHLIGACAPLLLADWQAGTVVSARFRRCGPKQ